MISTTMLAFLSLFGTTLALPYETPTELPIEAGCGELNVFYTYVLRSRNPE
jgi:hypothetical protein